MIDALFEHGLISEWSIYAVSPLYYESYKVRIESNDIGILNILLILFYLHSKWCVAILIVVS